MGQALFRWTALVLMIWVAGCAGTTTRVAGWYVTRKLDDYLDLTSEQRGRVRARVDVLIAEIRRDELPKALYVMRLVRDAIARNEVAQRIDDLQARSDALLERAAARLIPELASVLDQLDDAQITHFERKLRDSLDKIYEDQRRPAAERRAQLDEQLIEGLEKAVGDLSDDQQRTILGAAHALPDDRAARYKRDAERIASTRRFLLTHPGKATIERELRRLWDTRYDLSTGRDKVTRRAEQRNFLLTIDKTLTNEQREHAVERLNDRIRSLARFELRDPS